MKPPASRKSNTLPIALTSPQFLSPWRAYVLLIGYGRFASHALTMWSRMRLYRSGVLAIEPGKYSGLPARSSSVISSKLSVRSATGSSYARSGSSSCFTATSRGTAAGAAGAGGAGGVAVLASGSAAASSQTAVPPSSPSSLSLPLGMPSGIVSASTANPSGGATTVTTGGGVGSASLPPTSRSSSSSSSSPSSSPSPSSPSLSSAPSPSLSSAPLAPFAELLTATATPLLEPATMFCRVTTSARAERFVPRRFCFFAAFSRAACLAPSSRISGVIVSLPRRDNCRAWFLTCSALREPISREISFQLP
eukprot:Unigene11611_Nuclearia_a/m.35381 Unigene11611_Nuclearia_a/g.35381  ORF Unigene11611_Nuclearia_a/g.35381 Unigene11611_Nuclearia_a/m.35381 type:complete len:308 (+) Unigene11611_Nuclearia_a:728-1651(+)